MTDLPSAFSLTTEPFVRGPATQDLWLDDSRQEAVDRVVDAVQAHEHVLVEGEPGTGKSTVMRALKDRLSPVHHRCFYMAFVTLSPRDFNRQLCRVLGVEAKATPAALFDALQREVQQLHREHRVHPTLVIDEAHLMPDRTLAHLHVLANFHWDSEPLLSLILVGLPELHDRLKLGIHRSLLTRLSTRVSLQPATAEQTASYVRQRMAEAGARTDLFSTDGLHMLHELSGGLLRSIDILARASLRLAAEADVRLVDRHLVVRAYHTTPLA